MSKRGGVSPLHKWNHIALKDAARIQSVLWACDAAARVLDVFERVCPNDARPRQAIAAGRAWAVDDLSMNEARTAAFAAHAAARDAKASGLIAAEKSARAAGHAAATAHVASHAIHAGRYALAASDAPDADALWQQSTANRP